MLIPREKIFPVIQMILCLCAAVGYIGNDIRKIVYWLAAAILTASVTF